MKVDYSERAGRTLDGSPLSTESRLQAGEAVGAKLAAPVAPRQEIRQKPGPLAGSRQQGLALLFPHPRRRLLHRRYHSSPEVIIEGRAKDTGGKGVPSGPGVTNSTEAPLTAPSAPSPLAER